ncbi:MAG TPA: ribonuclease D [Thermoanaerobaculia bacterium]|nr:ribonuclease D [Thermoanaerobaculia bacterium]
MKWIADQKSFDEVMEKLGREPILAIDTEADSLHSYFDKVCLIQISAGGEDYLIDPLSKIDIAGLGPLLASDRITKVFHGADYDLRILNRDFGFVISNLIDTMVSAQLLGYDAFGLAALLQKHFGITVDKTHQRADWSQRPLGAPLLAYAALDTQYLVQLAAILRKELEALGRWDWAVEEFERLSAIRWTGAEPDEDAFRKIKGSARLERRGLAILKRLHAWRDAEARAMDRPPFKVLNNETLLTISTEMPRALDELKKIRGVSGWHLRKWGNDLVSIVNAAIGLAEGELPEKKQGKAWIRDKELERAIGSLRDIRDARAKELGLDASVLAPRHVLAAIASARPATVSELDSIPAMRQWQKSVFGAALIAAMADRKAPA